MKSASSSHTSAVALAIVALAYSAPAADDYIFNKFDTNSGPTEVAQWFKGWGPAAVGPTVTFDPAVDADGNQQSGSMKVVVQFDLAAHGGDNQFAWLRAINGQNWGFWDAAGVLQASNYTAMAFDVLWDTNSALQGNNFGYLEYAFYAFQDTPGATWVGRSVPTNGGWIHVTNALPVTFPDLIAGVGVKMWSGGGDGITGTTTFWVDNVRLIANTNLVPVLPRLTAMQKTVPGLELIASRADSQWQRQGLRTIANNYAWSQAFDPIEYAVTITNFPAAAYGGFQAHIFLPVITGTPGADPDWVVPHCIFVQITKNADESASARFMYKTNQPNNNAMLWNDNPANGPVGTLATIGSPKATGTWKLTFDLNGVIRLTTPVGTSTNFSMPTDSVALFANPVFSYFGIQPNELRNIGQSATFSHISISGDPTFITPINESFSAPTLDPAIWAVAAQDAGGVVIVPADGRYRLHWTLPANGFGVQASPNLAADSWADIGLTNFVQVNTNRSLLIYETNLPGVNGFFRLKKP